MNNAFFITRFRLCRAGFNPWLIVHVILPRILSYFFLAGFFAPLVLDFAGALALLSAFFAGWALLFFVAALFLVAAAGLALLAACAAWVRSLIDLIAFTPRAPAERTLAMAFLIG